MERRQHSFCPTTHPPVQSAPSLSVDLALRLNMASAKHFRLLSYRPRIANFLELLRHHRQESSRRHALSSFSHGAQMLR